MGRYQDALDYIFSFVSHEKQPRYLYNAATFNLQRMRELLGRLDNPQNSFQCVHIAGTKGKGSTSAMVEAALRVAGLRTGLYTSPHLHTFRERIRVNGALMARGELVSLLAQAQPAIEATPGVNTFEMMTALGFMRFAQQQVEWAVVEVGLGGRLDATNVVRPAVCAITSLSYDHVELLGHTLSLIAWEKAGIIKPGVPVVSAPQEPEALGVIERVAAETGARLVVVTKDWLVEGRGADLAGQTLTVRRSADGLTLSDLRIRLLGRHQCVNATGRGRGIGRAERAGDRYHRGGAAGRAGSHTLAGPLRDFAAAAGSAGGLRAQRGFGPQAAGGVGRMVPAAAAPAPGADLRRLVRQGHPGNVGSLSDPRPRDRLLAGRQDHRDPKRAPAIGQPGRPG